MTMSSLTQLFGGVVIFVVLSTAFYFGVHVYLLPTVECLTSYLIRLSLIPLSCFFRLLNTQLCEPWLGPLHIGIVFSHTLSVCLCPTWSRASLKKCLLLVSAFLLAGGWSPYKKKQKKKKTIRGLRSISGEINLPEFTIQFHTCIHMRHLWSKFKVPA